MKSNGEKIMAGMFLVVKTCFQTVSFLFWLAVLIYAARFVFAYYLAEMADGDETMISVITGKTVFSMTFYARAFFKSLGVLFLTTLLLTIVDMIRQKSWKKSEEWIVLSSKCVMMLLASYIFLIAVTQDFSENGLPEIRGQSIQELTETINDSIRDID